MTKKRDNEHLERVVAVAKALPPVDPAVEAAIAKKMNAVAGPSKPLIPFSEADFDVIEWLRDVLTDYELDVPQSEGMQMRAAALMERVLKRDKRKK